MNRWIKNIGFLTFKELKSLFSDKVLVALIIYMFSFAIITIAKQGMTDVKNGSVGIINYDHSALSYRLRDALIPPYFKTVDDIDSNSVDQLMDVGKYTFIIEIPPNYQRDMLAGRNPQVQLLVDATAMTQANIGASYITQIFRQEIQDFMGNHFKFEPLKASINVLYNPNYTTAWFMGTAQIVGNLTLLTLLLAGSAVIRERERGTMEHLLVMPVGSSEIAVAKILANGLVLLSVASLSLKFIVSDFLGTPINAQQIMAFMLGAAIFLFSIASLGILLAVFAPTMPQFGLLCIPIYIVMYMLSGTNSPIENMPELAQQLTQFSPTTILGAYAQDVLFRNAGLELVWIHLVKMAVLGVIFLSIALMQFKSMLSRQG
ncbi:ABC transporter permease [Mannheimia sp. AT1]|uniref:ABC transporter permease n=1 Tax=Mannheimia cairinae TaxID=3025936 RepID=A0ABT5MS48_9PAST|nr:ABC transporter permease [Mannheimia cairinae]MDD0823673.1 ABC transporter permease [Mannheimia cairinae]MDD0825395.1 ABC transporter permease [Mannheimia cairinae]